jgi:hypothetical protein
MRQLHPVHRPRHVHISEQHPDVIAALKYRDGLVRVSRPDRFISSAFDHFDGIEQRQRFVLDDEYNSLFLRMNHRRRSALKSTHGANRKRNSG